MALGVEALNVGALDVEAGDDPAAGGVVADEVRGVCSLHDVGDRLQAVARSLPLGGLEAGELRLALGEVRRLQRITDGLAASIGAASDALAARGRSAPADEFLLGNGEVRGHTARREAKRAGVLGRWPELEGLLCDGAIGGDHLDAIARRTGSLSDDERSRLDPAPILDDARRLPADTFDAALRRRIRRECPPTVERDAEACRKASELRHWFDHDRGMGRISALLDPERYESVTSAIERHLRTLAAAGCADAAAPASGGADGRLAMDANLAAAALCELVAGAEGAGGGAHLTVVVDAATVARGRHDGTICESADGHALPVDAIRRLGCDASVGVVSLDDAGLPLNVGRRYRTATPAQWEAIRALYRSCGWAACERPLRWTQLHHIREWRLGGRTDLDNLIPLCSEHHHRVHEGGWQLRMAAADRSIEIRRPDGALHVRTDGPPSRAGPEADR